MYEFESVESFVLKGRGTIHTTTSPVTCFRSTDAFIEACGPIVILDGRRAKILGVEMFMPGTPLRIGEPLSLMVEWLDTEK